MPRELRPVSFNNPALDIAGHLRRLIEDHIERLAARLLK